MAAAQLCQSQVIVYAPQPTDTVLPMPRTLPRANGALPLGPAPGPMNEISEPRRTGVPARPVWPDSTTQTVPTDASSCLGQARTLTLRLFPRPGGHRAGQSCQHAGSIASPLPFRLSTCLKTNDASGAGERGFGRARRSGHSRPNRPAPGPTSPVVKQSRSAHIPL